MKLVICGSPLQPVNPLRYPVEGNRTIEYEGEVRFPVNAVLAKTMKRGEPVKVILIVTKGGTSDSEENTGVFQSELNRINEKTGAILHCDTLELPFEPTKNTFDLFLSDLIKKIPNNADIIVDITYGMKPTVLPLFCALNFAEKFCNASIQNIIYGKAEKNKQTGKMTENPKIFDVTHLFYLNKLIGTMECPDAETAKKILGDFFAL
ncbi:MAG: TM1812 family CRISPR-associated protein [Treponema sp.]|jgi:hypothetical protein|nr:TM1812 family CRISPR-associated protein [Treponema sp.]